MALMADTLMADTCGYMRIDGAEKPLGPEEGMGSTGCLAFVKEVDPDSSAQT